MAIKPIAYITDNFGRLFKTIPNIERNLLALRDMLNENNSEYYKARSETEVVEPVAATVTTDLGSSNDIVYTAKTKGAAGNSINVAYRLQPTITTEDAESAAQLVITQTKAGTGAPTLAIEKGVSSEFGVVVVANTSIVITVDADADQVVQNTLAGLVEKLQADDDFVNGGFEVAIHEDADEDDLVYPMSATQMESTEAIEVDGTDVIITLGTSSGSINTDVAGVIALIEGDTDADALIGAVANESDDGNVSVDDWDLANGVDGTVATKGTLAFDSDYVYVAVDDCTVTVSNWKKLTLESM